jgi:hypothetical protein
MAYMGPHFAKKHDNPIEGYKLLYRPDSVAAKFNGSHTIAHICQVIAIAVLRANEHRFMPFRYNQINQGASEIVEVPRRVRKKDISQC